MVEERERCIAQLEEAQEKVSGHHNVITALVSRCVHTDCCPIIGVSSSSPLPFRYSIAFELVALIIA